MRQQFPVSLIVQDQELTRIPTLYAFFPRKALDEFSAQTCRVEKCDIARQGEIDSSAHQLEYWKYVDHV